MHFPDRGFDIPNTLPAPYIPPSSMPLIADALTCRTGWGDEHNVPLRSSELGPSPYDTPPADVVGATAVGPEVQTISPDTLHADNDTAPNNLPVASDPPFAPMPSESTGGEVPRTLSNEEARAEARLDPSGTETAPDGSPADLAMPKPDGRAGERPADSCPAAPDNNQCAPGGLSHEVPGATPEELPDATKESSPRQSSRPVSYEEFVEALTAHDVQLLPPINEWADEKERVGHEPRIIDLASLAGEELTLRGPDIILSTGPIYVPERWKDDVSAMSLAAFINHRHGIEIDPEQFAASIDEIGGDLISACGDAEIYFTQQCLALPVDRSEIYSKFVLKHCPQIILNKQGVPIAIRKRSGEDTCLVLRPILADGIAVQPGHIISIGTNRCGCPLVSVNDINVIGLLRLSEFILPEGDRLLMHSSRRLDTFSQGEVYDALGLNIQYIRDRVDQAVEAIDNAPDYRYPACHKRHKRLHIADH